MNNKLYFIKFIIFILFIGILSCNKNEQNLLSTKSKVDDLNDNKKKELVVKLKNEPKEEIPTDPLKREKYEYNKMLNLNFPEKLSMASGVATLKENQAIKMKFTINKEPYFISEFEYTLEKEDEYYASTKSKIQGLEVNKPINFDFAKK